MVCSRDFQSPNFDFALHDGPFAYGTVRYRVGIRSSNADGLYTKFRGRGGHGAVPQATIDPVMMAARFVVDVQSVISREQDPTEFGVVSILRAQAELDVVSLKSAIERSVESDYPKLDALYKDIHAHPNCFSGGEHRS
jgi:metal-dependent amidase/aminoacylase/carboxypeptidase family protein